MTTKTRDRLSTLLISRWEQVGYKLAALAEEFPERDYESRPASSVRTVGDVLRHLAFWNRYVADSASGRQADDTMNELPKAQYATKDGILRELKASAADATEALREQEAGLSAETAELVATFIEHTSEHYGQLVVYARIHGIVPPASRVQTAARNMEE